MDCRVTYLYNSGFLIECGDVRYIIDCCEHGLDASTPDGAAVQRALHAGGRTIALATHAHADHFQPFLAQWAREGLCELVLSSDIAQGYPATYLAEGESVAIGESVITAYGSTDQGVSYHISCGGLSLFHAGDLNDWHWQAESTPDEVRAMKTAFDRALGALPAGIGLALFPVDPRMGPDYDRGAVQFVEAAAPAILIPMHFREDAWAASQFAERPFPRTKIVPLTGRGQQIDLSPFE